MKYYLIRFINRVKVLVVLGKRLVEIFAYIVLGKNLAPPRKDNPKRLIYF